jgi:nucleotide-binding universal stress UspA family protein
VFSKILVPLDGPPDPAVALTPALTVARATGATLQLLTVIDAGASAEDHSRRTANLVGIAAELRAQGPRVDTTVRRGAPAAEIVAAASELGADLIVMATHGRGGLERAFLGSVAQDVLATSPVPVMLLRPGGRQMTKLEVVLVPVDGSPGGALALAVAVPLARSTNARIVLVDVVVPFVDYMLTSGPSEGYYFDPAWDDEARESAQRYLAGMVDRLRHAGVQAEGLASTGEIRMASMSVAEAIMRSADEVGADLIVMSTHALTGPARALLGSVADIVVRNARCPLLLPRRGGPEHRVD